MSMAHSTTSSVCREAIAVADVQLVAACLRIEQRMRQKRPLLKLCQLPVAPNEALLNSGYGRVATCST